MSYPDQVPARRPAAVTLAAAVLALMALGALAYAVATLLALGGTVDRFCAAAADTVAGADDVDGVVALVRAGAIVSAVLTVLVGVLLVGLAAGLLAGRRGARVATWVVSGLGLLGGCCTGALLLGQRAAPLDAGVDPELLGLLAEAYPSWWLPVNAGVSVAQMLGYLVVAVLLVLPTARGWFARRPSRPVPPPENPYRLHPPQGPLPPR
ncbi:hypothetical protein [Micromonospora coxensis]|uniref:hypothetical protein n=1 Tax=Micromonospora coxensis TaxID=356852 RepID=UPI003416948E